MPGQPASAVLPTGKVKLETVFRVCAQCRKIGRGDLAHTTPLRCFLYEGQDAGSDDGSPVDGDEHREPFAFSGKTDDVTVRLVGSRGKCRCMRCRPDGYVPSDMERRRFQPNLVFKCIVHFNEYGSACLYDGQHIFFVGTALTIASAGFRGLKLAARHNITSIRKCRYPASVRQARVPTAMIGVKNGAEDTIDLFGGIARVRQLAHKRTVISVRPVRKVLVGLVISPAILDEVHMPSGADLGMMLLPFAGDIEKGTSQ